MLRAPVTISTLAYDVLWEAEQLGPRHTTLSMPSSLYTDEERRGRLRDALDWLRQRGLAERGLPHPDLRDTLHLLARCDQEFYGWITLDSEHQIGAVAAVRGAEAVLAVLDGDSLALTPIRPDSACDVLIGQLPPVPAAAGRSISVPEREYSDDSEGTQPAEGFSVMVRSTTNSDADRLRRLMREPRTGAGQLYVATRDRFGKRHRCERPLAYIDTPGGRWLTLVEANSTGDRWIVASPATPADLARKLRTLHALLPGPA